jgi:outer membrane immunogenic protein
MLLDTLLGTTEAEEAGDGAMRNLALGAIGLMAVGAAAPATAADLAARPYTKAPPMVAAIYDWTGFYIGINGGGASSHNCWDLNNFGGIPVAPAVGEGCHDATGGLVGGQIGYRWQSSNFVFGIEGQGDWADLKGSNTSAAIGAPFTNETKINAIGLITGQVGYAWNNVLWYVKGGAAVTGNKYKGIALGAVVDQTSETRWGGVVGTGLEFGFAPNWSVAVEYDHLFMGNRNISFSTPGGAFTRTDNVRQDVDMGTVRVNYRWGGPVVAKY